MASPSRFALWSLVAAFALISAEVRAAGAEPRETQWVTLGTAGGPQLHADHAQVANALVVGDATYLFDVGNGLLRQMAAAQMPVRNVRAVFVSHHHLDHNADVGPLMISLWLTGRRPSVPLFGPEGTVRLVNGLASANAPTALAFFPLVGPPPPALSTVFNPTDLASRMNRPQLVYEDENVRVSAISVDHFQVPPTIPPTHMPEAVAYRVEARGRSYVYSGDTGPSSNLEELARGADVLVTEIVDPTAIAAALRQSMGGVPSPVVEALIDSMSRNHLTARNIGELASRAGVKSVVLTHFVPPLSLEDDGSRYREGIAASFEGPVTLARDLGRY